MAAVATVTRANIAAMQTGAIQEVNSVEAAPDNTSKKKAKRAKRALLLLRLQNVTPVSSDQVQQAYELLDLLQPKELPHLTASTDTADRHMDAHSQLHQQDASAFDLDAAMLDGTANAKDIAASSDTVQAEAETTAAVLATAGGAAEVEKASAAASLPAAAGRSSAEGVAVPASMAPVTDDDATPPAYAMQMDGPNDLADAQPLLQQQAQAKTGNGDVAMEDPGTGQKLEADYATEVKLGSKAGAQCSGKRRLQDLDSGPADAKRQKGLAGKHGCS